LTAETGFDEEKELLLKGIQTKLCSPNYPSMFYDLNVILMEIIM